MYYQQSLLLRVCLLELDFYNRHKTPVSKSENVVIERMVILPPLETISPFCKSSGISSGDNLSLHLQDIRFDCRCGTIYTIAPECIAVDNVPTVINNPKAVDLWGMGVCLYIMLSGRYPFQVPPLPLRIPASAPINQDSWAFSLSRIAINMENFTTVEVFADAEPLTEICSL